MGDLWHQSELSDSDHRSLLCALKALRASRSSRACECITECSSSNARDLIAGYACLQTDKYKEAVQCLAPLLLVSDSGLTGQGLELARSLLLQAAKEADPELAEVISNSQTYRQGDLAGYLTKYFYFSSNASQKTLYHKVVALKKTLHMRNNCAKTARSLIYQLEFLKCFSSSTHLTRGDRMGGGYFLIADGFGCVIDPGYDFLANFMKVHNVADINAIIVTHCHDDHNADLPALLSLLYRQPHRTNKVRLLLDKVTHEKYIDLINASKYIQKPCSPISASFTTWPKPNNVIEFTENMSVQPIPAQHKLHAEDESHSAVGLHFLLKHKMRQGHLVISGDTAWVPGVMENIYRTFAPSKPVLVVHTSTASEEEALGTCYLDNHLGIRGTLEMIKACNPSQVIISEIGEELEGVVYDLARLIQKGFNVPCRVGMMNDKYGGVVSLLT